MNMEKMYPKFQKEVNQIKYIRHVYTSRVKIQKNFESFFAYTSHISYSSPQSSSSIHILNKEDIQKKKSCKIFEGERE